MTITARVTPAVTTVADRTVTKRNGGKEILSLPPFIIIFISGQQCRPYQNMMLETRAYGKARIPSRSRESAGVFFYI